MACLLGLFSLVALIVQVLYGVRLPIRKNAWYAKSEATFSHALAAMRHHLWTGFLPNPPTARCAPEVANSPAPVLASLADVACYAA
jgi:hypothetical protein